jgi:PBP1b-binding outer membrane lipoprotein LpoB
MDGKEGIRMRKVLALFTALLLVAVLSLSVTGCMDRAMAPKEEEKKPAAETTTAPAAAPTPAPAAPATK